MVATKTFINSEKQNSDGDKSPSPEPFREPEGLVSIDLHNGRKGRKNSKAIGEKEVKYKEKVCKILVLVFIINIIVLFIFAIMVYLNEEKYLFKTKPLSIPIMNRAGEKITIEESSDPLEDMVIRCLDENSLSVCCDYFKNAETSFDLGEWCDLDYMISTMDIDIRRKRELRSRIGDNREYSNIVDGISDFVGDDGPKTINDMYTGANYPDHPDYYYYDYNNQNGDGNSNMDYDNDLGGDNKFIDYGHRDAASNYYEYPSESAYRNNIFNQSPDRHDSGILRSFESKKLEGVREDSKKIHETKTPDIANNKKSYSPEITTPDTPYSVTLNLELSDQQSSIQSTVTTAGEEYTTENSYSSDSNDVKTIGVPNEEYDVFSPEKDDSLETTKMIINNEANSDKNSENGLYISTTTKELVENSLEKERTEIYPSTDSSKILDSFTDPHNLVTTKNHMLTPSFHTHDRNELQNAAYNSEEITESVNVDFIYHSIVTTETSGGPITTMSSSKHSENSPDLNKLPISQTKHRANEAEENRSKMKSESFSPTVEMQSNSQAMFNPCLSAFPNPFYYPYKMTPPMPYEGNQVMKVIPSNNQKAPQFILNPPMYPYMQASYIPTPQYMPNYWPQNLQQTQNSNPIQVSGPGGQFYVCNPIPPVTNNIASVSGIEVRRTASNLQDILIGVSDEFTKNNKSRESQIICPLGQQSCDDGSKCIPEHHVCDNEAHCGDGSDEVFCTCKQRVGKLRTCDGYFDCPDGQDELGCFGCDDNEFSCDDWSRFRKSTCIPIEHRCDGIRHCQITGKDEEDCSVLADNVGDQPQFKISNSVGFLHRNFKGKWYPTCFGTDLWATEICQTESGPTSITPRSHMMLTTTNYEGYFINILPDNKINLVKNCVQDRAAFVECPPLFCGLRMTVKNPYRPQEVDTSAENMIDNMERLAESKKDEMVLGNTRVVGGKPSQPAAWPWLVSIYKNGIFHCGGVLINEIWIVTAAHCVDKYWLYYYEIQAGMLRRFSYAPMEQHRWASVIVANENYDRSNLKNDIALMKLSSPVRFNRYVRPICLPSEATAGHNFMEGPSPGTICTTVGWGATIEHGSDPDHMREVEVPILKQCKHPDDKIDDEICAGLWEGGRDACQGDSGGPLMCRNPNNPSQWHLAGIVSHGEGCARPEEPGVYTKVSKYVGWIAENIRSERFSSSSPLQSCPGFVCKFTNQCLPKKHHCDKIVDCLFGDDESNCKQSFHNIFKHSRENSFRARLRNGTENVGSTITLNAIDTELPRANTGDEWKNFGNSTNGSFSTLNRNIELNDSTNGNFDILVEHSTPVPTVIDNVPGFMKVVHNGTQDSNHEDQYFSCESLTQLIPFDKKCDKVVDCEDGTDEDHCLCVDYIRHSNSAAICDGVTDCFDESDERNCSICNAVSEYHCRQSKQCIPLNKRCDEIADCMESEDEWDCAALTNGRTLTLDSDLRPELAMSGIITINRFGVWRPFCSNMSDNEASIVTNVCNLLGFEEYVGYHKYLVEDRPTDVLQKNATKHSKSVEVDNVLGDQDGISNASNKCSGLTVQCSVVSLDKSMNILRQDNITSDIELYTSPWNALIYSDGMYRCMGTILDPRWIITSVNCFKGITTLNQHYISVLLGTGKVHLQVRGPHEQTLRVVETVAVPDSDIILLRTGKNITYTRYVKNAFLDLRRDGRRRERCVAIGLHQNNARYMRLTPIEFCNVGFRCFESNLMKNCEESEPWSGTIVCDSTSGWYPAAVYHEASGPCGLTAVKKFTSIPFYKNKILDIMRHASLSVIAPPCDGFRCALGKCIDKNKTCDGIPDCRNGEDELRDSCDDKEWSCHLGNNTCECPLTHLKCKNGMCVPKYTFCDAINDCGDNSDEPESCSCRAYLELTDPSRVCDGKLHCLDRSDEDPKLCPCRPNDFNCISSDACVGNDMVCDGIEDCPNGEDEKICFDLSSTRGRRSNAGEVLKQTGGIWHKGCFNMSYNSTELEKICEQLGFFNSSSIQLKPPNDNDGMTTLRPVIDSFDLIRIHRNQSDTFSIGIRRGNEPYVKFVPDERCYRLFVACL